MSRSYLKLKKVLALVWPYLFISVLVLIFFYRLFLPQPSLFYTPDYGRSDIWHFNYPIKNFLSQSLKRGRLPFWNRQAGTGFPFFAESQIGALNLTNLLGFWFLPTWLAWNLSYPFILWSTWLGMYLFLKNQQQSTFASLLAGFAFAFSGFFIGHFSHFNLVQTASFLPWLLLVLDRLMKKPNRKNMFFFALLLSQQIFSGHPQIVFISLVGLGLYLGWQVGQAQGRTKKIRFILLGCLAVSFGLLLAGPQIIPLIELVSVSIRRSGISSQYQHRYPYPLKFLITFILPYFFGSPKNGSYQHQFQQEGIFWENIGFMGITSVFLSVWALTKGEKTKQERFFILLAAGAFLLVWGKHSPLYFIFDLPPFNFFRLPSRFIVLVLLAIAYLAGAGLDQLTSRLNSWLSRPGLVSLIKLSILTTLIIELFSFGFNYHPLVDYQQALQPPAMNQLIDKNQRIATDYSQHLSWNQVFKPHGWQSIKAYLYFKNGLDANLNLLYNQAQVSAFHGLATRRQYFYQASLNPKLLAGAGVNYLIASREIPQESSKPEDFELIKTLSPSDPELPKYYLYQLRQSSQRFRLVTEFRVGQSVKEVLEIINQPEFSFDRQVVLEEPLGREFSPLEEKTIKLLKDTDCRTDLQINIDQPAILVAADSFYPGWQVAIDGQPAEIRPANLNQRAIVVPAGTHIVKFTYFPQTFLWGVGAAILGLLGLFCWPKLSKLIPTI